MKGENAKSVLKFQIMLTRIQLFNWFDILRLSCEIESFPAAQVEWFFNETNITQKVTTYKEKFEYKYEPSSHSVTLIIKNVNEKDKGNYTLQVKNKNGTSKSTCFLDVNGIIKY